MTNFVQRSFWAIGTVGFALVCDFCEPCFGQSAREIVERSIAAMAPPIQYKQEVNGIISDVFQQTLSNHLHATKIAPQRSNSYFVSLGEDVFEVHPDMNLVIDRGFLRNKMRGDAIEFLTKSGLPKLDDSYALPSEEAFFGIPCWRLVQPLDQGVILAAANAIATGKVENVPSEVHTFISKDTYQKVGVVTRSENGIVALTKYSDIQRWNGAKDEFFLPPARYLKVTPKSIEEYGGVIRTMVSGIRPKGSEIKKAMLSAKSTMAEKDGKFVTETVESPSTTTERVVKVIGWLVIAIVCVRGVYSWMRLQNRMKQFVGSQNTRS